MVAIALASRGVDILDVVFQLSLPDYIETVSF